MNSLKQQFTHILSGVEKYLWRSIAGLSFEDDKRVEKIASLCGGTKSKVVIWKGQHGLGLAWNDILYYSYRFEKLPTDKEVILIYQYGIELFVRLMRLGKIKIEDGSNVN